MGAPIIPAPLDWSPLPAVTFLHMECALRRYGNPTTWTMLGMLLFQIWGRGSPMAVDIVVSDRA